MYLCVCQCSIKLVDVRLLEGYDKVSPIDLPYSHIEGLTIPEREEEREMMLINLSVPFTAYPTLSPDNLFLRVSSRDKVTETISLYWRTDFMARRWKVATLKVERTDSDLFESHREEELSLSSGGSVEDSMSHRIVYFSDYFAVSPDYLVAEGDREPLSVYLLDKFDTSPSRFRRLMFRINVHDPRVYPPHSGLLPSVKEVAEEAVRGLVEQLKG
jgi:hypothetical protein